MGPIECNVIELDIRSIIFVEILRSIYNIIVIK